MDLFEFRTLRVGSKVVRSEAGDNIIYRGGQEYRVVENKGDVLCNDTVSLHAVKRSIHLWELAEQKEMFDMKTQPWFIKINSQEEFDLVQEWLIENYGKGLECVWEGSFKKYGVTNRSNSGMKDSPNRVMWMGEGSETDKYASEIKFNFRKVIDNVKFPDVKSEQELEIERLTEIINQAQETLSKMKGEK